MPSAAVETAFRAKLTAGWTGTVLDDDVKEPPAGANHFLVVQYPVINSSKPVLAVRFFEEGAARLVLNVKDGIGIAQGLIWADTLAGLFREYRPGGGFETFTPSAPIINDRNDDGNWFELAVIVPYRYQFNG